jgi:hypothetical protein
MKFTQVFLFGVIAGQFLSIIACGIAAIVARNTWINFALKKLDPIPQSVSEPAQESEDRDLRRILNRIDGIPEPVQFTDREKKVFTAAMLYGCLDVSGEPLTKGATAEAIDAAMLSAGLRPQERESVSIKKLIDISEGKGPHTVSGPPKHVIEAIIKAIRATDGSIKDIIYDEKI